MRLTSLALALLAIAISTSIASAACNPPKFAATGNPVLSRYAYWTTTITDPDAMLVGRIWSGATDNTGTCNNSAPPTGLYFGFFHDTIGLSLSLGNACVVGCPSGSLSLDVRVLDATRTRAQMLMVKVPETPAGGVNFDFSEPDYLLCDVPHPVIDNLSSSGTTRTAHLSIGFTTNCGNAIADITGWNIRSAASSTDPGILGTYGLRGSLAVTPGGNASASGTVPLDCSNTSLDQWVTAQVVTNGAVNHLVGPTTRVTCKTGSAQCSGAPDGTLCDDGNPGTFHDTCHAGNCVAGCSGTGGCSDGDACTANDTCVNGTCTGTPIVCDDGNPCTTDTCDPATGCVFTNNTLPCNDNDPCTTGDTCSGGSCHPGAICDDGNPCTLDTCQPGTGACSHATLADGSACAFGTTCSVGDTCHAGICMAPVSLSSAAGSPVPVDMHPSSLASGDFNRDGLLDLAVANQNSNDVTILLGNGAGGFAEAGSPGSFGISPHSVIAADLDRDGALDLVVAHVLSDNVSVLRGNGSGQFSLAPGSPIGVGDQPVSVAVGDFNLNGRLDLAVVNSGGNNVTILDQVPSGSFNEIGSVPAGTQPAFVATGDLNGDGTLDLVVANSGSNDVTILLGDGREAFAPASGSPAASGGLGPNSLALADLNGDGKLDIALANSQSDNVTILFGDGTGRFTQAGPAIGVGAAPLSIAVSDVNGDGLPDLAVANSASDNVTILLNIGSGGFAPAVGPPVATGASPDFAAFADINGDGKPDLAVVNRNANDVAILMNDALVAPDGQTCDDRSACTTNDVCVNGSCVGAPSSCVSQCAMPPSGLTGWWPGEGVANDISGSGNNGSLHGITFTGGIVGQAFSLGGNAYLSVPASPTLVPDAGSFSVGAWIKSTPTGGGIVVMMNECGSGCRVGASSKYELGTSAHEAFFGLRDFNESGIQFLYREVPAGLFDGNWHLVVATRDIAAHKMSVYVDDLAPGYDLLTTNANGPIHDTSNQPFLIGAALDDGQSTPTASFSGLIDEVMYANRAFTPAEVQALYAAGSPRFCRCVDADGDGYGAQAGVLCPNGTQQDCNDSAGHGGVWSAPVEVRNVKLSNTAPTALTWDAQATTVGPDVTYDVIRGDLGSLAAGYSGSCIGSGITTATMTDPTAPAAGSGFWYFVRGHDTCGVGSFGNQGIHGVTGAERVDSAACP